MSATCIHIYMHGVWRTVIVAVVESLGVLPGLSVALTTASYLVPLAPLKMPDVVTTPVSSITKKGSVGVTISNSAT